MASTLIEEYTETGDTIFDPFCGSGTIALEAWRLGRNIIATDLSPYAVTLTKGKLSPPKSLDDTLDRISGFARRVPSTVKTVDLRKVPKWVRSFFHPETLRETIAWFKILKEENSNFLLSCLLGILHHQRPGFLSYPSSHTTPYLRERSFPRDHYPDLYKYRSVQTRLEKKVRRAFKRLPQFNENVSRTCQLINATEFITVDKVQAIVTSPPYMRQLDYGRDNRLRLWFLGDGNWKALDKLVSPKETDFLRTLTTCLSLWKHILTDSGKCVLVIGDSYCKQYKMSLPNAVVKLAIEGGTGFSIEAKYCDHIPQTRRVRRNYNGNQSETILVLSRNC